MGLPVSTIEQVSALPIVPPLEAGLGGLVAAVALIYLLGYIDIVSATDAPASLRRTLIAVALPLFLVFVSVVLVRSLSILAGA